MRDSTPRAAFLLVVVFAAGVAAGIAAERLWLSPSEPGFEKGRHRGTVIEKFSEELELGPGQRARIDTILSRYRSRMHTLWSEVRPRYRALVDSVRQEIEQELSPDQVRRYRELLERREERFDRKKRMKEKEESEEGGT